MQIAAASDSEGHRPNRLMPFAAAGLITALCASLPALVLAAPEESKTDTIGPWQIEATFKSDKFDHCAIRRTLDDDVTASFVRTDDGLTLTLESPNWKLEHGKKYTVHMNVGGLSFDTDVVADPDAVSLDVTDKKFAAALRSASALNVVAAGATIRVPLDRSTAAFDRLEQCFAKNSRAVLTNPFVAPPRAP